MKTISLLIDMYYYWRRLNHRRKRISHYRRRGVVKSCNRNVTPYGRSYKMILDEVVCAMNGMEPLFGFRYYTNEYGVKIISIGGVDMCEFCSIFGRGSIEIRFGDSLIKMSRRESIQLFDIAKGMVLDYNKKKNIFLRRVTEIPNSKYTYGRVYKGTLSRINSDLFSVTINIDHGGYGSARYRMGSKNTECGRFEIVEI